MGSCPNARVVIDLPNSEILRVVSRSLFFAVVILAVPCFLSIIKDTAGHNFGGIEFGFGSSTTASFEFMNVLFQDFAREGLVKKGDKVIILGSEISGISSNSKFLIDNEIHFAMVSGISSQGSIPDGTFHFVLLLESSDAKMVDPVLKVDGILAVQLKDDPVHVLEEPSNYKAVYIRRYDSTIVAMRKMDLSNDVTVSSINRKLYNTGLEAKRAALKGLERPFLEPPRRALGRSSEHLKNIKYLPELMGDSLRGYKRRVFIAVSSRNEENDDPTVEWFHQNYPSRSQKFEVYSLKIASDGYVGISDWLRKNIDEGDYVVMKAEADIVGEMMQRGSLHLVDEVFLECKNRLGFGQENKGERAYWECLSLYGMVKDEGVAVHQWWG
ncbi:hypothetical protein SAY86_025552 [Trapa natans]|uniref:DUF7870 domain-containing protein n=1 Tax=Trapa natans TaxID=22666 RepID=A0AAN7M8G9_TRANT|nr:hypothetical protein SAY86_025552 [Trapa natans]